MRRRLGILPSAMPPLPRFLAYLAAGLVALGVALLALRDGFVVPLITGQLGDFVLVDHFWTPLINWMGLGLFVFAAGTLGSAAWARHRDASWDAVTPRVLGGCLVALAVFGALVGVLAALAS